VADDAHGAATATQLVEHGHHRVESLRVEGAEALVDEERVQLHAAALGGDDVGQPERQGERGHEALAAGQRLGGPAGAGVLVEHVEAETAAGAVATLGVAVQERVAPGGHLQQPAAGHLCDLLQARGEHERLQPHLERVGPPSADEVGECGDLLGLGAALGQLHLDTGQLGGEPVEGGGAPPS